MSNWEIYKEKAKIENRKAIQKIMTESTTEEQAIKATEQYFINKKLGVEDYIFLHVWYCKTHQIPMEFNNKGEIEWQARKYGKSM